MEVIKQNINRCRQFYHSDFYKLLETTDPGYIDAIFDRLCEDPDACDAFLYQALGDKFHLPYRRYYLLDKVDGQDIRLAADVICGRKQLVDYRRGKVDLWIEDYELVRSNLNLHLIWPKHKAPTINTYRYTVYLDRIDCLLYDLKLFFDGQETPMAPAYQQELTAVWLSQFSDFPDFIKKMNLTTFVDDENNVLDISTGQQTTMTQVLTRSVIKEQLDRYLCQLLKLIKEGSFG